MVKGEKMSILEQAIETYGKDMQLTVAVEEFSELIKEICKNKRGRDNIDSIIEEMADCYIMLSQLGIIFGIAENELNDKVDEKLARLQRRLAERSENDTRKSKGTS
jgi:NTP pyrophosphatase (non-canonical NTP hydrolase)